MGSPANEAGRNNDEAQHRVTITRAFFMMTKEVTQAAWANAMGKNPSSYTKCGDNCPVEKVSWYDAVAYANALSAKDGFTPCYQDPDGGTYDATSSAAGRTPAWASGLGCLGYRLPTEAEWEYAARSGTTSAFDTGPLTSQNCSSLDANLDAVGWYSCNSNNTTHVGATKRASPWGLFDMHGNVFEWVWDFYGPYDGDAVDPLGPSSGSGRVNRGGGWWSPAVDCRAAMRLSNAASKTFDDTGLRLVRSVP
jgi:formylglycine-generating enzyme required for sulfatase activity